MEVTGPAEAAPSRSAVKSAAAFRTIAEVALELDVPQHVLRFWETKFSQVKPLKRRGGRRYYRPEDIELLRRVRGLLYRDGYTIKGVQKLLREGGAKRQVPSGDGAAPASGTADTPPVSPRDQPSRDIRPELHDILAELKAIRDLLHRGP